MAKTLQELFTANSIRELFSGEPSEPETSLREVAGSEPVIPPNRNPVEEICQAALPGDKTAEECWFEALCPTPPINRQMREQAQEGHRIAEEFPERGAYHGGPPVPDMGGITQPADPRNLCGPFVPVPPDQVPPPMTGGFKMKIQPFDEYVAKTRAQGAQGSPCSSGFSTGPVIGNARGFPIIKGD